MRRRLRFAHYAESADEGATLVAYLEGHNVWDCGRCGEVNKNREFCGICSARRGEWGCDCGHLNPKDAEECESCGREKPDAE